MKKNFNSQQGSVIAYILLAVFLIGVLTITMMEGPKRSAQTQQLDELGLQLADDIALIESMMAECTLMHPSPVDIDGDGDKDATDNPNAPLPLIYDSTTGYADPVTGPIAKAICPGAPPTPLTPPDIATDRQLVASARGGRSFRILNNTALYTTTYTSDTTEGVYVRLTRASANELWTEALSRLNDKYSACKAVAVTAAGDCVNGCFYYWIKRDDDSVIGTAEEPACL